MLKLIRQIGAIPFRLVADILGYIRLMDPEFFRKAAWKISGQSDDAIRLLILVSQKRGIAVSGQMAKEMMAKVNDCAIAVMAGFWELSNRNYEQAKTWLEDAKRSQAKNPEQLLYLELYLSQRFQEYNTEDILNRILERNDLPGAFTRQALVISAELHLEKHQWASADQIAEKILAVEEYPFARWIKWVIAIAAGRGREAEDILRQLGGMWQEAYLNKMKAFGWYYAGDIEQTYKYMELAEKGGIDLENAGKPISELAKSEGYISRQKRA
jgi:hypothetical protein